MADLVTVSLDSDRFNERIADVYDALAGRGQEGDAANLVKDETRRFVRQVVRFLPPQSYKQGAEAVRRELTWLISEVEQKTLDEVASRHGLTNVDAYLTNREGQPIRLKWENIDWDGSKLQALHYRYKNKRGKVPPRKAVIGVWSARIVVPQGMREPYIQKTIAHVGRLKASWCGLAEELGLSVASWIKPHLPSPMAIGDVSGLHRGSFPVIVLGSRAPGIGMQRHVIQDALRVRAEAMRRRAALIIADYDKALAQGMKLATRERREAYDQSHPENDYGSSGIAY